MNKPLKFHKFNTIKAKMIGYYMIIIMLMAVLSVFSLAVNNRYKSQIDEMFVRSIMLKDLSNQINEIDKELVNYLATKNSGYLNSYMQKVDEIKQSSNLLMEEVKTYSEEELMMIDIRNMIYSYVEKTDRAVEEKRKTNVQNYTSNYNKSLIIKQYISDYISELNNRQLDKNAINYTEMSRKIQIYKALNIVLIIDSIFLSLILVYFISSSMIQPLTELSKSAEEISMGNFDTDEIVVRTNDEIEILAFAFNKMKNNIYEYIEKVKEKAQTEAKLKDQEIENMKMHNLLERAKLYALQSQMNPHFLFNTINAGVQLSMMEEAEKTSEFLECMSRLFRYNIKQINSSVSILQEIGNIKDYYELLQVRFDKMIVFHFNINSIHTEYRMPPLILQPLIENAYIHGLSKKEEGGNIYISVVDDTGIVQIIIRDDGVGMSSETIDKILYHKDNNIEINNLGQSNGVGLKNVIERLELFYERKELLLIESQEKIGTTITVSIPYIKET